MFSIQIAKTVCSKLKVKKQCGVWLTFQHEHNCSPLMLATRAKLLAAGGFTYHAQVCGKSCRFDLKMTSFWHMGVCPTCHWGIWVQGGHPPQLADKHNKK
jgi:hypothetical protein